MQIKKAAKQYFDFHTINHNSVKHNLYFTVYYIWKLVSATEYKIKKR